MISFNRKNNDVLSRLFASILVVFLVLATLVLGLCVGAEDISVYNAFSKRDGSIDAVILFNLRLPRLLLAGLCGMLLAGAGTIFQGFFRNPLADSGLIGISSGATLGAVISSFIPIGFLSSTIISSSVFFAFSGALGAAALVYVISHRISMIQDSIMMLLIGTAIAAFLSAVVSILILFHYQELYQVYVWTLGSFNGRSWDEIQIILLPSILAIFLLSMSIRPLDILSAGEESAQALGVNIKKTRFLALGAASLACACAVSVAGTISFIGLIAPHIARKLYGPQHRNVLYFGMLWGAILLMISDILARIIAAPTELPVGIVTALMGGPFFIFILNSRKDF